MKVGEPLHVDTFPEFTDSLSGPGTLFHAMTHPDVHPGDADWVRSEDLPVPNKDYADNLESLRKHGIDVIQLLVLRNPLTPCSPDYRRYVGLLQAAAPPEELITTRVIWRRAFQQVLDNCGAVSPWTQRYLGGEAAGIPGAEFWAMIPSDGIAAVAHMTYQDGEPNGYDVYRRPVPDDLERYVGQCFVACNALSVSIKDITLPAE